jgi:hypothetical protein
MAKQRASKIAKARAEEILEIKPGSLAVYTAYLVLFVRLVVLAFNGSTSVRASDRSGTGQLRPARHPITSKPGARRLGEAATQTGLSPTQLRQWEQRRRRIHRLQAAEFS